MQSSEECLSFVSGRTKKFLPTTWLLKAISSPAEELPVTLREKFPPLPAVVAGDEGTSGQIEDQAAIHLLIGTV
jgi:hypothetical protein